MAKVRAKKVTRTVKKKLDTDALFDKMTSVRFKMGDKVYEVDVGSELLVGSEDHHMQVEKIPATLGYFGSVIASLEADVKKAKLLKKKVVGVCDKEFRRAGMRPEARVLRAIECDERYIRAELKYIRVEQMLSRAKFQMNALLVKHEVMISRSADIRKTPSDSIMGVSRKDALGI